MDALSKRSKVLNCLGTVAKAMMVGCVYLSLSNTVHAADPVTTEGNQVLFGGKPIGYAGNSFFWGNTGWGGEKYYTADVVKWLKNDWNSKIVRAAMGVEDNGGYLTDPQGNVARVKTIVDAAIAEDIYVIIDWHSHNAEKHTDAAVTFFQQMAQTYGGSNNVIYEIYNEPIYANWSQEIKPYAETVIAAIREIDADNLIIVGTPFYSQNVDAAEADPIVGYKNIAYTLHFYSGTHGQELRDKAIKAMNPPDPKRVGIPLFVTEWGAVNANGDGGVNAAETANWVNFMKQYKLTHLNWSVHDKQEGASALRPGASTSGGWGPNDLTESGALVKSIMLDYNPPKEVVPGAGTCS